MKTGELKIGDSQIIIYQTQDGKANLDVRLENDTIWLTQKQIADLFGTEVPAITKHINNIVKTGELDKKATVSKMEIVQHEGKRDVVRNLYLYNLDMILSIGYRVNSKNATQFRIWANKILKDYLVKGYAVNDKLKIEQYEDLKQTIKLLSNVLESKELTIDEATGLLLVVRDYSYGLDVLDKYDFQTLDIEKTTKEEKFRATYENAMATIANLKEKFGNSSLFGNEKDKSFQSSMATIYQTFDGNELYPSVEEKAAMLLYLVIKNHSFSDGNKRIAALLFLWFLDRNGILYYSDGSLRIGNNALVALTLMIAESRTEEKDMMVKVVVNLINKNN